MKTLARQIKRELNLRAHKHCAVYEHELQRLWPLNLKEREAKIAQFAKEHGFRLRFYRKGLRAIFDEHRERFPHTLMKPDRVRIIAGGRFNLRRAVILGGLVGCLTVRRNILQFHS